MIRSRNQQANSSLRMTRIEPEEYFPLYQERMGMFAEESCDHRQWLWPGAAFMDHDLIEDFVGSREHVKLKHMLFPLVIRCLPEESIRILHKHVDERRQFGLASQLGMAGVGSNWTNVTLPMRCSACIQIDIARDGTPYSRRCNIIPGLTRCSIHGRPLGRPCPQCMIGLRIKDAIRHPEWHCGCLENPKIAPDLTDTDLEIEISLSKACAYLLDHEYLPGMTYGSIGRVIHTAAIQHRIASEESIIHERFIELVESSPARILYERMGSFHQAAAMQSVLRGRVVLRSILKNIVLLITLCGSWSNVERAFSNEIESKQCASCVPFIPSNFNERKQAVKEVEGELHRVLSADQNNEFLTPTIKAFLLPDGAGICALPTSLRTRYDLAERKTAFYEADYEDGQSFGKRKDLFVRFRCRSRKRRVDPLLDYLRSDYVELCEAHPEACHTNILRMFPSEARRFLTIPGLRAAGFPVRGQTFRSSVRLHRGWDTARWVATYGPLYQHLRQAFPEMTHYQIIRCFRHTKTSNWLTIENLKAGGFLDAPHTFSEGDQSNLSRDETTEKQSGQRVSSLRTVRIAGIRPTLAEDDKSLPFRLIPTRSKSDERASLHARRDAELSNHVRDRKRRLVKAGYPRRIGRRILIKGHPLAGNWYPFRASMPLTVAAINDCIESDAQFEQRKSQTNVVLRHSWKAFEGDR
jgi:hypothetical protein